VHEVGAAANSDRGALDQRRHPRGAHSLEFGSHNRHDFGGRGVAPVRLFDGTEVYKDVFVRQDHA
jgi:hypothetical protein